MGGAVPAAPWSRSDPSCAPPGISSGGIKGKSMNGGPPGKGGPLLSTGLRGPPAPAVVSAPRSRQGLLFDRRHGGALREERPGPGRIPEARSLARAEARSFARAAWPRRPFRAVRICTGGPEVPGESPGCRWTYRGLPGNGDPRGRRVPERPAPRSGASTVRQAPGFSTRRDGHEKGSSQAAGI